MLAKNAGRYRGVARQQRARERDPFVTRENCPQEEAIDKKGKRQTGKKIRQTKKMQKKTDKQIYRQNDGQQEKNRNKVCNMIQKLFFKQRKRRMR